MSDDAAVERAAADAAPGVARHDGAVVRLCGHSRCRRALPDEGTGRKFEYCPDRTWDGRGGKTVTCRELGRAERLLRDVHGDETIPDTVVVDLRHRLGEAAGPVGELHEVLGVVNEQLATTVAAALDERDTAKREAAEERGRRRVAEEGQETAEAEAVAARAEAQQLRRATEDARAVAEDARARQRHAEDERTAAVAQRDAARDHAERLERRLDRATAELEAERERASGLQDARLADVARHAGEVSELKQSVGRLEAERGSARERYEAVRRRLDEWRAALIGALSEPVDALVDPVRARARELLQAPTLQETEQDGVADA